MYASMRGSLYGIYVRVVPRPRNASGSVQRSADTAVALHCIAIRAFLQSSRWVCGATWSENIHGSCMYLSGSAGLKFPAHSHRPSNPKHPHWALGKVQVENNLKLIRSKASHSLPSPAPWTALKRTKHVPPHIEDRHSASGQLIAGDGNAT